MNLNLEAYDWWATKKIPTQYRILDSYSKSFNGFAHINDENGENLFDEYLKVWDLHFIRVRVGYYTSPRLSPRSYHRILVLITVAKWHSNPKRKNVMEFIRRSLQTFVTLAMPILNLFDVPWDVLMKSIYPGLFIGIIWNCRIILLGFKFYIRMGTYYPEDPYFEQNSSCSG